MKIYALNSSPRKTFNTAKMLNTFTEGIHSVQGDVEVELIHLYDYNYTGCRSCFACQRKGGKELECSIRDAIHNLLQETFNADGIVFASPVYFYDITAQMRGFLERLMYPGVSPKCIPMAFIYTSNATEQQMKDLNFAASLGTSTSFLERTFHSKPEQIFAYNTYQYKNYDDYRASFWNELEKKMWHETQFPIDCQKAFELGVNLIK